MSRRILVLGADGFIGRRLLAGLADGGFVPVAGVRRNGPGNGFERVCLDGTDASSLKTALTRVDGVVNSVAGGAPVIRANADALARAAGSLGIPVVHLSSMAVYGSAVGKVDEAAPLLGDTGPYAEAKVAAERSLSGLPSVVFLRPGIVYGPGSAQWSDRIARWLRAGRIGDLGAAGDGCCNLVQVDDVAAAAVAALDSPATAGRAFNLGSPEPPTWNQYFLEFARALGAVPLQRVPGWRLKLETRLLAPPLKVLEILVRRVRPGLRLPPPIPPSLLGTFSQDIRLVVGRAERELGMRWRRLEDGLAETAREYARG